VAAWADIAMKSIATSSIASDATRLNVPLIGSHLSFHLVRRRGRSTLAI
jgi:hypothetical protein